MTGNIFKAVGKARKEASRQKLDWQYIQGSRQSKKSYGLTYSRLSRENL